MINKGIITGLAAVVVIVLTWFIFFQSKEIGIEKGKAEINGMNFPESALSGINCEKAKSRPLAVMFGGDKEARPLSGISEADMVFEMPVTDGGVTRMMAVFQCRWPKEMGSVRSSRIDFIPLAQGLNAIYAHWGGEKEALKQLDSKVIDNVDAMKYDGTIFYRKKGVKPPYNGFTSPELISKVIKDLDYSLNKTIIYYPHEKSESQGTIEPSNAYQGEFEATWKYDASNNSYLRFRQGQAEIDKNSGKQVEAKNVILLKTTWSPINKDYIRVKTVGSGTASFYKNGQEIKGAWEKRNAISKLTFYDAQKQEIKFTPGQIWVEIII